MLSVLSSTGNAVNALVSTRAPMHSTSVMSVACPLELKS